MPSVALLASSLQEMESSSTFAFYHGKFTTTSNYQQVTFIPNYQGNKIDEHSNS